MKIGLFKPNPKKWHKITVAIKTLIGTLSASQLINGNEKYALYLLIIGALFDFITNIFTDNNNDTNSPNTEENKS